MRYPPDHKEATRLRILDAASRLFRRDGYTATGIDSVMAEADLTAGAFYGHFDSKDDLLHATMESFFEQRRSHREDGLDGFAGLEWVEALIDRYLSVEHLSDPENGCILPSLTPELSRATAQVRDAYQGQILQWAQQLGQVLEAGNPDMTDEDRRSMALGAIAAMVGGMSIARAMPDSERAELMLQGARRSARAALRGELGTEASPSVSSS